MGFSPCSGNLLASGTTKGRILVWDIAVSGSVTYPIIEVITALFSKQSYIHQLAQACCRITPLQKLICNVKNIWQCYGFSTCDVSCLAWNPSEENLIASTSFDGTCKSSLSHLLFLFLCLGLMVFIRNLPQLVWD